VINGVTPDVNVAFGGGAGTLAEVAFAEAAGRVLFFHKAIKRLRENFEKYFGPRAPKTNVDTYFREPLLAYPEIGGKQWTANELMLLLARVLHRERDMLDDADALVARCLAAGSVVSRTTGFPSLPGNPASTERFEHLVREMSQ
jgi:hypothetical protein